MQLNEKQKEAVEALEGPVLVVAGAGAGKTRVLTERILNLIKKGKAEAHEILAITFTNKAAKEMRERVLALLNTDKELNRPVNAMYSGIGVPFISTFHSLGVHIMREQAKILGIKKHFNILDRQDSVKFIKDAMKQMMLDPKEEDPKAVLNEISRAKADALTPELYLEMVNSFKKEQTAHLWRLYENAKQKEGAFDFDDLLLVPMKLLQENQKVLEYYQNVWKYILVDEYQDTNKVQFEMLRLLAEKHQNIFAVGDEDQCFVSGTKIKLPDGKEKDISKIKTGEHVLSLIAPETLRPRKVTRVIKKQSSGDLYKITTLRKRELVASAKHMFFSQFEELLTPQKHFVYLMYKKDLGFRLGVTQTYSSTQRKRSTMGFAQRLRQENADKLWIVKVCSNEQEARFNEAVLSLKYGIPTMVFKARFTSKRPGKNTIASEQKMIDALYQTVDTKQAAKKLMNDFGLHFDFPHLAAQSASGKRLNINVVLSSHLSWRETMAHRVSIVTQNKDAVAKLKQLGLSVRKSKRNSPSFRVETAYANIEKVMDFIDKVQSAIPEVEAYFKIRIKKSAHKNHRTAVSFMPASSLREGMVLYDSNFKADIIEKIEKVKRKVYVYDLDIEGTHNYVANDILVHNSIYAWRQAKIENILNFDKFFPNTKKIFLEQNYRSTKTIIEASNAVIEKNEKRQEKTLFTERHQGEPIELLVSHSAQSEAQKIAKRAKEFIQKGTPPNEIAVLYRVNFVSRVLEEAFLREAVPYQILGTRFFDRKEVKDFLSFLRLAFNRDSLVDLHRAAGAVPRGLGKVTLLKVQEGKVDELSASAKAKLQNFFNLLDEARAFATQNKLSDSLKFLLEKSGLKTHLESKGEDGKERLLNIFELINLASKYDSLPGEEAVFKFLEEAALAQDQDELEKDAPAVKLMTVHAAKGLEFNTVFVVALEQGIFPLERMGEDEDEEEERRLFYVALTRAKEKLFLSRALERTVYGETHLTEPSEFLQDIPEHLLEQEDIIETRFDDHDSQSGKIDLIDW